MGRAWGGLNGRSFGRGDYIEGGGGFMGRTSGENYSIWSENIGGDYIRRASGELLDDHGGLHGRSIGGAGEGTT